MDIERYHEYAEKARKVERDEFEAEVMRDIASLPQTYDCPPEELA